MADKKQPDQAAHQEMANNEMVSDHGMMNMTVEEANRMMQEQNRGHGASGHGNQGMMDQKKKSK